MQVLYKNTTLFGKFTYNKLLDYILSLSQMLLLQLWQ